MAKMTIDGYGQVELNNVAFRRDGRIEAQCALRKISADSALLMLPPQINFMLYYIALNICMMSVNPV